MGKAAKALSKDECEAVVQQLVLLVGGPAGSWWETGWETGWPSGAFFECGGSRVRSGPSHTPASPVKGVLRLDFGFTAYATNAYLKTTAQASRLLQASSCSCIGRCTHA